MHWQSYNKILVIVFSIIIFLGYPNFLYSQSKPIADWEFLSTSTIDARQFIASHPEYDGRAIVIFILDSGVDMGVPGLTATSEGKVKVIDAQDFSGQGDVSLYSGKIGEADQEKYVEHPDGFRLYNYQRLDKAPPDDSYLIGYLDEKRFANSDVKDINNNGRDDDRFGVLAFEVSDGDSLYWNAYVDTDGDQQIDDENAIRDYRVNFDTFQLRGGEKHFDRQLLTFALNIVPEEMIVSLHFDDNGHGTHVAGIAAGYKINDEVGFNGIAPGAQIISLKIGNGTYEGGCTVTGSVKKALEFATNYARIHNQPIVINISYGTGSIQEGSSDIDFIVNSLLTINDNIFVCVSNGNDGPGISTTGTPAAAQSVFSVGALLSAEVANKYYGTNLKTDKIFYFSACGGELNKPDALAPGSASSTIPQFMDNDFMRGTSMAAPQASGAAALLLSAAIQSEPKLPIKNILIHRALKFSAHPISGYNYLEQGSGVINVPDAFRLLQSYSNKHQHDSVVAYEITTESPALSDGNGASAYWRTGDYFPQKDERQTFTIRPVFSDTIEANAQAKFYRAFELAASHPWLIPVKKSVYIKGEMPASIEVRYDPVLLSQPGIYSGKIFGYRKQSGQQVNNPAALEFELLNTIIIPYIFDQKNGYEQEFLKQAINPGDVQRYFIQAPVGATAAKIKISPSAAKFCSVTGFVYDPAGRQYALIDPITSKEQNTEIEVIPEDALSQGVWEIDIYSDFANENESIYDLSISFSSFKIEPVTISDFTYEVGKEPRGDLQVTNQFTIPFYGFGRGSLIGYQKSQSRRIVDRDVFTYDFTVEPDVKMVEFDIDFDDESFVKFTDVAITIYDSRGKAVARDAMDQDRARIYLDRISGEAFTLEIVVAFAYSKMDAAWRFKMTERYYTNETITIKIYQGYDRVFKFYPFITKKLDFTMDKSPRIPPEGFSNFGTIEFIDRNLLQKVFTVPIEFYR